MKKQRKEKTRKPCREKDGGRGTSREGGKQQTKA